MKLNISHGISENLSIIEFSLYRGALAVLAGIVEKPEYLYIANYDKTNWEFINKLTDYFGYWKEEPNDEIWYLIAHSDTEGVIKPDHAALLATRLCSFTNQIKEQFPYLSTIHKSFIKGLSLAAKNKEEIIFK